MAKADAASAAHPLVNPPKLALVEEREIVAALERENGLAADAAGNPLVLEQARLDELERPAGEPEPVGGS